MKPAVIALIAWALAMSACSGTPDNSPRPGATKSAKRIDRSQRPNVPEVDKSGGGLRLRPLNLGPITGASSPDADALSKVLPAAYETTGTDEGAKVSKDGRHMLTVVPNPAGDRIERVRIFTRDVAAPRGVRVGTVIGTHHNWSTMTCELGTDVYDGQLICYAFEERKIEFVLESQTGALTAVPPKDVINKMKISGMIWNPKATEPDVTDRSTKPVSEPDGEDQGGGSDE